MMLHCSCPARQQRGLLIDIDDDPGSSDNAVPCFGEHALPPIYFNMRGVGLVTTICPSVSEDADSLGECLVEPDALVEGQGYWAVGGDDLATRRVTPCGGFVQLSGTECGIGDGNQCEDQHPCLTCDEPDPERRPGDFRCIPRESEGSHYAGSGLECTLE